VCENNKNLAWGKVKIDALNSQAMTAFSNRRVQYDTATNFGTITEKQNEWEILIAKEPESLKRIFNRVERVCCRPHATGIEVDRPQKNIPFALITSAIVVTVYYFLIQLVCIGTLPGLAISERPLAEAAQQFMGQLGGNLIAIGALISIMGTLNVLLLSASRLPFALSHEKQLPALFGYIHPKYRTPGFSLIAMSLAIIAVSLAWSFFTALSISSIFRALIYLLVCGSLLQLRKQKKVQQPYLKSALGIILQERAFYFVFAIDGLQQNELVSVCVFILIGLILYYFLTKDKKK
jgi:amino acid transporter